MYSNFGIVAPVDTRFHSISSWIISFYFMVTGGLFSCASAIIH